MGTWLRWFLISRPSLFGTHSTHTPLTQPSTCTTAQPARFASTSRPASGNAASALSRLQFAVRQRHAPVPCAIDVLVPDHRNVQQAYRRVQQLCRDGQVKQLEIRNRHYVKPTLRRQQRHEWVRDQAHKEQFRDKVRVAMELLQQHGCPPGAAH